MALQSELIPWPPEVLYRLELQHFNVEEATSPPSDRQVLENWLHPKRIHTSGVESKSKDKFYDRFRNCARVKKHFNFQPTIVFTILKDHFFDVDDMDILQILNCVDFQVKDCLSCLCNEFAPTRFLGFIVIVLTISFYCSPFWKI